MLDPNELFEMTGDLPQLERPVLLQALDGFVDAGSAVQLAREHVMSALNARLIARFDIDQLLDYRSRRPTMKFVEDHWESYDEPVLGLYHVRDDEGTAFLMLAGPEPDLQWERFIAAALTLIERLDVRITVGLTAIPMAVPHTRPIGVTAHATRPELIAGYEPWLRQVQVPASVANLLEYRLGKHGHDAIGFAVHVPHYLAQSPFPAAAEELLTRLSRSTGLLLPTEELRSAAELVRVEVDKQVAAAEDATALVKMLEQQYDSFSRGRGDNDLLAAETAALPTADELGAELERFLAEHNRPPEQPPG
ncbi:proteasome assembly chaperone family protein [Virgisporangium ochraceum]|uniref:proteasome assembly chaperone family protein n=1 Tax=Virgisporangium ochraceum TaxID=65505 RepID=UPI00194064E4|nr:PAC2 family protein [Virgisporangium ochraceum]